MKRFLYGRLHAQANGYRFYILPAKNIGDLASAIASEDIRDGHRLLFLQHEEGVVTFGVKEKLTLKDYYGRLRSNFMGYQPDASDGDAVLPFFNALSRQFEAITRDAHQCHALLEKDPERGKKMQEGTVKFDTGSPTPGNDWDKAVLFIHRNAGRSFRMVFNEQGARIMVPEERETTQPVVTHDEPIGITSSIEWEEEAQQAVVPVYAPAKKRRGLFYFLFGWLRP